MDLIEIDYHDYLASCVDGIYYDNWLIYKWPCRLLTEINDTFNLETTEKMKIGDLSFTIGDDHIELYDGYYDETPITDISPQFGGRLTTFVLIQTVIIKNEKIKGKMCIRNPSKAPIYTEYELFLKKAEMKMTIGLGPDSITNFDHSKCEFPFADFSFTYLSDSKMVSVLDKITDDNEKKLFKRFILNYMTKDVAEAAEDKQQCNLNIKESTEHVCGQSIELGNLFIVHNKISHKACKNLTEAILDSVNTLVDKMSPKLSFDKILGISNDKNGEKALKIYKGFMNNFNSLRMVNNKDVTIIKKDNLVTLHALVEFGQLNLNFNEVSKNQVDEDKYDQIQSYTTERTYLSYTLERVEENKVNFKLLELSIMQFKPLSGCKINMAMDYLISHAVGEHMKPIFEKAFENENLQELAIKPDVEIEYTGEEFRGEDSELDF